MAYKNTLKLSQAKEQEVVTRWLNIKQPVRELPFNYTYISIIKKRLPTRSVDSFLKHSELSQKQVARFIHISERTLQRNEPAKKLGIDTTEKLLRLARLFYKGIEVLGEKNKFNIWLERICVPLGNQKPIDLLDTSLGMELVLDELQRIEYGVIS